MLVSATHKLVLLDAQHQANIARVIPHAKPWAHAGTQYVVVPHRLEEARLLRNMGFNVPAPIETQYDWPKPPHVKQEAPHQVISAGFLTLHRRAFLLNEIGTMKTLTAYWAIDYLMRLQMIRRVVVISPKSSLKLTHGDTLFRTFIDRTFTILTGEASKRRKLVKHDFDFYIINPEGVEIVLRELIARGDIDLVLIDECFVAGSPVATSRGEVAIEDVCIGDQVLTPLGYRRVQATSQREVTNTVTLEMTDGTQFECTPNHPIFTDLGWLCAADCSGREVFTHDALRDLRNTVHGEAATVGMEPPKQYRALPYLLNILRQETNPSVASRVAEVGAVESTRKDSRETVLEQRARSHCGREAFAIAASESAGREGSASWRQRQDGAVRSVDAYGFARAFHLELPDSVGREASRLSYELQGRFWLAGTEDRNRSGWAGAPSSYVEGSGREKNRQVGRVRVARVTHHQRRSTTHVYNLQVEECPWYYVAGKLVHNCAKYRNAQTARWKAAHDLIASNPKMWVWGMTGRPIPNEPTDAYGQVRLINPAMLHRYGYTSFRSFKEATMNKVSMFRWVPKADALDTVAKVMQPSIRFSKSVLKLDKPIIHERECELTPAQKKAFNELLKHFVTEVNGGQVTALNEAVKVMRLIQTVTGTVYDVNGTHQHIDCGPRLEVVKEILEEAGRKTIIYVPFTGSLMFLKELLEKEGYDVGMIYGGTKDKERDQILYDFQNHEKPDLIVAHPACMSHSLTLTAANTIVWWGPIDSNETYTQANGRIDRKGQEYSMNIFHISATSAERKVFQRIANKQKLEGTLLEIIEEMRA